MDAQAFVDAIGRQEVGPFAAKPITLKMLLRVFSEAGDLPKSQRELYERGCFHLCEEMNRERRESGGGGEFSPTQRLAAATRIAAATIFANRRTIWIGEEVLAPPGGAIAVHELCGGGEPAGDGTVEVSRDLALEALQHTGLFTSHSPDTVTWAHQTYAEYLAGRYVFVNNLDDAQILSLLTHPQDGQGRIIPQLQDTAASISCRRESIFEYILKGEPETLLLSDVASAHDRQKRRLVEALLRAYEDEKLYFSWNTRPFRKLKHPNLADQLLPYITDKSAKPEARLAAVYMAEETGATSLVTLLAEVALDQEERHEIRVGAASAVAAWGDEEAKARLRPLALGQAGHDRGNHLCGIGLRATWPNQVSAEELFDTLVETGSGDSWTYMSFVKNLKENLREQLSTDHVPAALRWVARTASRLPQHGDLFEMRPEIMRYAWEELDAHPELLDPFAEAATACLLNFENVFKTGETQSYLDENPERRRRVLARAVDGVVAAGTQPRRLLLFCSRGLLRQDDLLWILDRFPELSSEAREAWTELVQYVLPWDSAADLSQLLQVAEQYPILFQKVRNLNPVELDSDQARQLQKNHHWEQRTKQRGRAHQNRTRRRREECLRRIDELVEQALSGSPDAWWQASVLAMRSFDSVQGPEPERDLTASAFWKDADEAKRTKVLAVAKSYLLAEHDWQTDWVGDDSKAFWPAIAAYWSLRLLQDQDPGFLGEIPPARWRDLAPVVLAYRLYGGEESKEPHTSLVRHVYHVCPDELLHWVGELISRRTGGHWIYEAVHQLAGCLDDRLCGVLLEKAKDEAVGLDGQAMLLDFLLQHGFEPAMAHCLSLIPQGRREEGEDREGARQAALLVVRYGQGSEWPHVWQFVMADPASGCWLFRQIMKRPDDRKGPFPSLLSDQELAELYLWLQEHLPREQSANNDAASGVRRFDGIEYLKNGIISSLKGRGAVPALRRLQERLPDEKWLPRVTAEAEEIRLRDTWKSPSPREVVLLGQDRNLRFVENGRQLLGVLLESLKRYQQQLQGEGPVVCNLWDNQATQTKPVWRPKSESHLSNNVAEHLRRDLQAQRIVVNREVEIRPGEETDVHVTTFKHAPNGQVLEPITAIIEAKGCWHDELEKAMQTQLVGRYLRENRCAYGIYLVGWFDCAKWTGEHPAKSQCPSYGIDEANKRFGKQALELSKTGGEGQLDVRAFVLDARLK